MRDQATTGKSALAAATLAWLLASAFYFYQYLLRSAPAVMMPQLAEAYGLSAVALAGLVGLFYYGYAPFSLVAGVAMDQLGARRVIPLGAAAVGLGALLFATGDPQLAGIGRLLQGAGGVFALIGASYIAGQSFPAARAATLIGATQMFGMAGGSAGQFVVGPAMGAGMAWNGFWIGAGVLGLGIALLLFVAMPRPQAQLAAGRDGAWARRAAVAMVAVFTNPQVLLCGLISGLMFIPTTIFDMVWGVRFLEEAHDVPFGFAVLRSASVPFGWIIGCPLLGWLSDRIGRRKPVIAGAALGLLGCMAMILYGPPGLLPPFVLGLATGIVSGAAMLPYTVAKEASWSEHAGTATGVVNFINFTFSALLGPFFGGLLARASAGGERDLADYQAAFQPMLYGVGVAVVLTLILRETGPGGQAAGTPRPGLRRA